MLSLVAEPKVEKDSQSRPAASKKLEVLKRQADFNSLKKQGKYLKASDWLLINFQFKQNAPIRPSWTISKKIGKAVTRNRLKRWVREFVRKLESDGIDFNIIFKSKSTEFYKKLSHQELDKALRSAFKKIEQRR